MALPRMLLAVFAATAVAPAAWAAQIELRAQCRPAGPVVTLGDVAQVAATDPQQVRDLETVDLFPSPPPGERRFVRLRQIQDLLLARGVNLVDHQFSGSSQVAVGAAGDEDSPTETQPLPMPRATVADGNRDQALAVAVRTLPRGAIVGAGDVRLDSRSSADGPAGGFDAIEEVLGQQTTREIAAGEALAATSVRPPVLVRRGEVVTVFARSPGIRVRSAARARNEGCLGDLIAVESFEDRKTFLARVSGVQEVEVYARALRSSTTADAPSCGNNLAGQ